MAFSKIAKITDFLFLSSCTAVQPGPLREHNITTIINATMELPDLSEEGIETLRIMVADHPGEDLAKYFDHSSDFIERKRCEGGRVLVHCMAGVSRSASLCIAYLMKYGQMTLRDAYHHVKARRSVIRPNSGFFKQLIEYEKKLFNGKSTVSIVSSNIGPIPDVYEAQVKDMMW